jgi:hypothetical protein
VPERLDRIHFDVGGREVASRWTVGQELKNASAQGTLDAIDRRQDGRCRRQQAYRCLDTAEMLAPSSSSSTWTRSEDEAFPERARDLRDPVRDAVHNRRRRTDANPGCGCRDPGWIPAAAHRSKSAFDTAGAQRLEKARSAESRGGTIGMRGTFETSAIDHGELHCLEQIDALREHSTYR